jgi:NDP-sugar pyrophosphorylase family protein
MTRTLEVVAGGKGTRIRTLVQETLGDYPKHLLPLPVELAGASSLLGTVLLAGADDFSTFRVHVRDEAAETIGTALRADFGSRVVLAIDTELTGPLGPFARMLTAGETLYFAGGDAYCTWDWKNLIRYHEAHALPVTALFATTVGGPGGARITVAQDAARGCAVVTRWDRVPDSADGDLMNIGAYIFDGTPEVLEIFAAQTKHSEDNILGELARRGLLAAYVSPDLGFNINTAETYTALIEHLARNESQEGH